MEGPGIESRCGEINPTRPDRPESHPASRTKGNGSVSQEWSAQGVTLTAHSCLALRLKKE